MDNLNRRLNRPEFARPSTETRIALGFVAFLMSSALVGSLQGLFEMQSTSVAMARAAAQPGQAGGVLAEREQRPNADLTNTRRRASLPPA